MPDAEVLIRCVDVGDTYIVWRWLDDPRHPHAVRLDGPRLQEALSALEGALIPAGEDSLRSGAFTGLAAEYRMAKQLTQAVLPSALTMQLLARCDARRGIRVRLLPSPRLSRVPWETLVIEPGSRLRLLDVAAIVHDLPATVRAARSRDPVPWEVAGEWPAAMIVDPVLPKTTAMQRVLATDNEATGMFLERVDANRATQGEGFYGTVGGVVGRLKLAKLLGARRSRLFYFGHVTARTDEPGSASMHLTDPAASVWGLAEPIEGHRPLSALDLLSGVQDATREYRAQFDSVSGPDIWPMPTRVALISCEGAADYRTSETFGLVSAMVKAGAGMVTATRWPLPTDSALWAAQPALRHAGSRPTTELALAVDAAHTQSDPIAELLAWQRGQLDRWRTTGDVAYTPLIWGALTHTWVPTT